MKDENTLTPQQEAVLKHKGTEPPGSGALLYNDQKGVYRCAACDSPIFDSQAKYESRTPGLIGWPSFDSAREGAVKYRPDTSLGMERTEVVCATCGGHLGHVFDADDAPSGRHFCINSVALCFEDEHGQKTNG